MKTRLWFRPLSRRPVPPTPPRGAPGSAWPWRLLEDRWVPSTIVVTNPTDTPAAGTIDLRQAIAQANAAGGDQTITFDPTVFAMPQTILLSGGQLELSDTTGLETITGPAAGVTVDGGGQSRVFQVDELVTASISGLKVAGGNAYDGGGVYNAGGAHAGQLHHQRQHRDQLRLLSTRAGGGGVFNTGSRR